MNEKQNSTTCIPHEFNKHVGISADSLWTHLDIPVERKKEEESQQQKKAPRLKMSTLFETLCRN